ncbi:hypothetical protein FKM82_011200 [Ascaphus truei]
MPPWFRCHRCVLENRQYSSICRLSFSVAWGIIDTMSLLLNEQDSMFRMYLILTILVLLGGTLGEGGEETYSRFCGLSCSSLSTHK